MKRYLRILPVLLLALALCACGCKHEWTEASCESPKTCTLCQETEGEALGHNWEEADCETAKTCTLCGITEGEALGHIWTDATTEAPKTCTRCAATEGERIVTDPRFTTAACEPLFGTWICDMVMTGEDLGEPFAFYVDTMEVRLTYIMGNDGNAILSFCPKDQDWFTELFVKMSIDSIYAELEDTGLSRAEIDARFEEEFGMTIDAYVRAGIAEMDLNEMFTETGVYYVDSGKVYLGENWNDTFAPNDYELKDGILYLPVGENGEMVAFARVENAD